MTAAMGLGVVVALWLKVELLYALQLLWEDRQARREVDAFLRSGAWRAPPDEALPSGSRGRAASG